MENLFTTPDTSREMQELGFPQNTVYVWYYPNGYPPEPPRLWPRAKTDSLICLSQNAAPTMQEAWDALPKILTINGEPHHLVLTDNPFLHPTVAYANWRSGLMSEPIAECDSNLAEACAKMWVWLKRNGYLTPSPESA